MKAFAVLFLAALASAEINWKNVKPVMDVDGFWQGRDPDLARAYQAEKLDRGGRIVNGEVATPHQFPHQVSC